MKLIGLEPLLQVIEITLQSAYIKGLEYPINLLLIAIPESGKSASISMKDYKIEGTYLTNNISQSVILSKIFPKIENEGLKHIIIPDILNVTDKDSTTKKGSVNTFKTLMEEGFTNSDSFNLRTVKYYNPPIKCGVITAITSDSFNGVYNPITERMEGGLRHYLRAVGMLSRFMPFSYKYSFETLNNIFESIDSVDNEKVEDTVIAERRKIKRNIVDVKGTQELYEKLHILSFSLGKEVGGYGIRAQRNLINMAKANARLNGNSTVTQEDIDKILELSKWINYDFNPL